MNIHRILFWPTAAASYLAVGVAVIHWITDTWSGIATLGMGFAVLVGVPSLVGYSCSVLFRRTAKGLERLEVTLGFALPLVLLALVGFAMLFGRR
jgi:hypothetical protein